MIDAPRNQSQTNAHITQDRQRRRGFRCQLGKFALSVVLYRTPKQPIANDNLVRKSRNRTNFCGNIVPQ